MLLDNLRQPLVLFLLLKIILSVCTLCLFALGICSNNLCYVPYFILFFHIMGSVKYQAKPLIIYTSTKSEEPFLRALQRSGKLIISWLN